MSRVGVGVRGMFVLTKIILISLGENRETEETQSDEGRDTKLLVHVSLPSKM